MNITYAAAAEQDAALIYDQTMQLIHRYENLEEINYDKVLHWCRQKVEGNIHSYTRILADGCLAGFYRFSPADGKMEIDDLYIFPAYQNQGIGTRVIRKCLEETDLPVFLYVFIRNTGAFRLYQRMGFQIIKTIGTSRYIMEHE